MIFDSFPTLDHATTFVLLASRETEQDRDVILFTDGQQAMAYEPFPFPLAAPVVLVSRVDGEDEESVWEPIAESCGGMFVGT